MASKAIGLITRPMTELRVTVLEAKPEGDTYMRSVEKAGFVNPYIVGQGGSQKRTSSNFRGRTLTPNWDFRFTLELKDNMTDFTVAVWNHPDAGAFSTDSLFGEAYLTLKEIKHKLDREIWFPLMTRRNGVCKGYVLVRCEDPAQSKGNRPVAQRSSGSGGLSNTPHEIIVAIQDYVALVAQKPQLLMDLSEKRVRYIPKEMHNLCGRIIRLDMSRNQIVDFPHITRFNRLEHLTLTGNKITSIPAHIGLTSSITELFLQGNQITDIPPEIGLLTNLERLDLSNNQLSELPREIGLLVRLEDLILSGNPLQSLPHTVGCLAWLQLLNLDFCQLRSLPEHLSTCAHLLELHVTKNQITTLPFNIGRCTRLCEVNLSGNQIQELPFSFGACEQMSVLNLSDNPWCDPKLRQKINMGAEAVVEYFFLRMDDAKQAGHAVFINLPAIPGGPPDSPEKPEDPPIPNYGDEQQIGRASCRERV
eukprot:TRINITY_DN11300_c0_g1_i1.p1 TRINITY_DN11300_c0_g1~~TRINITY_DN11300_c0_g1_i1.p1  ORF type:complete len:477 (+),score=86.85 TRINITY_DN11300_c0_g1_i1:466-1896(+)